MSQKAQVLSMLRLAGPKGVRSDQFIRDFMPRAAARVQELKDEGYEISSEREGKYVRYQLIGVGAGVPSPQGTDPRLEGHCASVDSGEQQAVESSPLPGSCPTQRSAPPESLFPGYEIREAA